MVLIIIDKMNYLSKEFKVAVAIYNLTIVKGLEATKASLQSLTPIYMNSGELTASIHFLESWGMLRRHISPQKIVSYTIFDDDLSAIQRLHDMCWGK